MAINQVSLLQLTNEIQAIGTQINAWCNRVQAYNAKIISIGIAGLQAAPYSLSSADATALFNAAADQDNFRKVYAGLMYVAAGATLNTGVPTNNDGTHFGFPFAQGIGTMNGLGY